MTNQPFQFSLKQLLLAMACFAGAFAIFSRFMQPALFDGVSNFVKWALVFVGTSFAVTLITTGIGFLRNNPRDGFRLGILGTIGFCYFVLVISCIGALYMIFAAQ